MAIDTCDKCGKKENIKKENYFEIIKLCLNCSKR